MTFRRIVEPKVAPVRYAQLIAGLDLFVPRHVPYRQRGAVDAIIHVGMPRVVEEAAVSKRQQLVTARGIEQIVLQDRVPAVVGVFLLADQQAWRRVDQRSWRDVACCEQSSALRAVVNSESRVIGAADVVGCA
eukprot:CAMPEP_0198116352 /NCGR_PEP_ID=MMETSP1442-20131203/11859_1 /TAXON_ID= /ORGANISM="Craspedostauros australis, Strain CCMP3328" /LENGTH=132 /DNA_ID=CAMNT_0043774145 /DNA_START=194 /DNA_END=592 /DNA_ORIENTATION=-